LAKYAEVLKVNHGYALEEAVRQNSVIAIPGLAGQPRREISTLRLTQIIQARMEEILDYVQSEIVSSGYQKMLIGGIVMTGGGAQLRHMKQLVEYHTGMHCRIGSPNYHVSLSRDETKLTPILSTGVGLLMTYENKEAHVNVIQPPIVEVEEEVVNEVEGVLEEMETGSNMVETEESPETIATTTDNIAEEPKKPAKKGGGIMDSLDWLRRKFEDQFKENLD
jgi:cell division protein FtsA